MIKNIILDFGDIFIDLDKSATARFMGRFGFKKLTPDLDELFKKYEKGHMSSRTFLEKVSGHFPMANELDLVTAWNSILLNFPDERLEFIETLAKEEKYRLFLLSNTNDIHIEFVKRQMGPENFNRFKNAFEAFYLSYEMGMRKPDTEIFEFVLKESNLKADETLFVDDTKENTDAASHLGIKIWNLKVGQEDITQLKAKL